MNKKLYLEAPQAELIVVRFEENIMSAGDAGGNDTIVDDETDY